MKKTFRIWTAVMVLFALLVPSTVFAASSSVSVSGGSAQVGKNADSYGDLQRQLSGVCKWALNVR